jgi:hypothetical protein
MMALAIALAATGSPAVASSLEVSAEEQFFELINDERTSRGLNALGSYWDLVDDARGHSADMAAAGDIWHNPDLALVTTGWYLLAENVGMGPQVGVLHEAFMDSEPHRENVLRSGLDYLGVGVVIDEEDTIFVTMVFMDGPAGLADPESYLPPFSDDEGSMYEPAINALAEAGITKGCNPPANDHFCPQDSLSRGEMAAFLARGLGLPVTSRDYFTDDEGSVFEQAINSLAGAGITVGCAPGHYCPSRDLSRGELAAFLARALELPLTGQSYFADLGGSVFAADINTLAAEGITQGCAPDRYCPDRDITRAEMASFLARALDL